MLKWICRFAWWNRKNDVTNSMPWQPRKMHPGFAIEARYSAQWLFAAVSLMFFFQTTSKMPSLMFSCFQASWMKIPQCYICVLRLISETSAPQSDTVAPRRYSLGLQSTRVWCSAERQSLDAPSIRVSALLIWIKVFFSRSVRIIHQNDHCFKLTRRILEFGSGMVRHYQIDATALALWPNIVRQILYGC